MQLQVFVIDQSHVLHRIRVSVVRKVISSDVDVCEFKLLQLSFSTFTFIKRRRPEFFSESISNLSRNSRRNDFTDIM